VARSPPVFDCATSDNRSLDGRDLRRCRFDGAAAGGRRLLLARAGPARHTIRPSPRSDDLGLFVAEVGMELEHRFEVPVGVEKAWNSLLDMELVGPCFPGAILDHVEGDDFSGSVKIKLGPIRMTYKGHARIVEKDEATHRAKIEATGNAGGSTSPNRTQVDLVTTLSLTGRPAQFGRGVMVDVGNKLIGQFADCVSTKLAGHESGGAELVDVTNPDEVAADYVTPTPAAATAFGAPGGAAPAAGELDLWSATATPILKRVLPIIAGIVALILVRKLFKRHPDGTE
jgi:carbon monoxide dehydrogenase subunit G